VQKWFDKLDKDFDAFLVYFPAKLPAIPAPPPPPEPTPEPAAEAKADAA